MLLVWSFAAAVSACGGSEPEAEATWETHTTASDDGSADTSGGEEELE